MGKRGLMIHLGDHLTKKIFIFFLILFATVFFMVRVTPADAGENLSGNQAIGANMPGETDLAEMAMRVRVAIGGKTSVVAAYSGTELSTLPQTQVYYSSLDATSSPVVIAAEGITMEALLSSLGITAGDVREIQLTSSDGWQRSFSADEYLHRDRYYYPAIVDGYDKSSVNPPEFALDTDTDKQSVAPMLALKSYEGRFETSPDLGNMTTSGGIRFCFGQTAITDAVMLNYGKQIKQVTFVLKDTTAYTPLAEGIDSGDGLSPAANPGVMEEIENEGLMADTLTITVGYYGGTYYTKKVFSLAELQAMDQVRQVYSYIDNMPAVCLDSAVGIRLTDIMEAAGIDINSIQNFHFYCTDVARTWYLSVNKDYLLGTLRYYYPNLPRCWDYDEAEATAGATEDPVLVDTIIALKDNWRRFATEEDFNKLTDSTRFRLVFGQTDVKTLTSSRSAKWVHTIAVTLGGTPPAGITLDASALELEVGSEYRLNAILEIADQTTDQRITWSSSDPDIVSVDSRGRIKVLRDEEATVTTTTVLGDLSASVVINGKKNTESKDDETTAETGDEKTAATSDNSTANTDGEREGSGPVYEIIDGVRGQPDSLREEGVQNWRVYSMSESATALADIAHEPNPLAFPSVIMAALLLLSGILVQTIYYFKQL